MGANGLEAKIPIGAGANGNQNPTLSISDFYPHSTSATPKNLELTRGYYTKEIRYDSNSAFRQILTSNRLVDIVTVSPYKFEIRQYDAANKGTKDSSGLYVPTGAPLEVVAIENPVTGAGPDYNRLMMTTTQVGSDPVVNEFAQMTGTGTLRLGQGLDPVTGKFARVEFRQSAWISYGTDWEIILTVTDGNNVIASRTRKRFHLFDWGKEQVSEVVETGLPGHSGYTETWEYYTNPAETGKYSKVKAHVDTRGYWTRYDYDVNGKESKRVEPFKDSPVGTPDAQARVIETTRSTDSLTSAITKLVVEKVLGEVVSREFTIYNGDTETRIVCLSPTAAQNDPSNLVTVTKRFTTGPLRGKNQSVISPDGTIQLTSYVYNGDLLVVTSDVGEPNSGKTAVVNGTRTVTTTNLAGVAINTDTLDIATGLQTGGATVTEFDAYGRAVKTQYLDGTWERTVHGCCDGADSVTDKMGVTTYYKHDPLGRVLTATRQGVMHRYTYDGEGRQLSDTRVGTDATEIVQGTVEYDLSGDKKLTRDTYNYITSFSHPGNSLLNEQQTNPDTGVILTEYYLDGNLKAVSGSAAKVSGADYLVEGNSRVTKTVTGSTCINCPNTEWVKSYKDMAGREYKRLYPDGAQELMYYNSKGQLWKSVDADANVTLLEYDSRGRLAKRAVDMNKNDVIDLAGTDRIFATAYSVQNAGGKVLESQSASEWQTSGSATATVVQTSVKSVSALETTTTKYGLATWKVLTLNGDGTRTEKTVKPDGTAQVVYLDGDRRMEEKTLDSAGTQVTKVTYGFDAHGRVNAQTDARNGTTDMTYYNNDLVENVVLPPAEVGAARQLHSYVYDTMGRQTEHHLPDASVTYSEYFATGNLKRTHGSQTYDQSYTYDAAGRRKTLTTDGNRTTTWNYDAERGWLSQKLYPDNQGPSYSYTPGGKLAMRLWARGYDTIYAYNNAGELVSVDYGDTTADIVYAYNRRGLKSSVMDATGTRTFGYNASGTTAWEGSMGVLGIVDINKSYDALQRLDWFDVHDITGFEALYGLSYDNANRILNVTDLTPKDPNVFMYTYEPNSNLIKSISHDGKVLISRDYDKLNRVNSIQTTRASNNAVLAQFNYNYNSLNQRIAIENQDSSYWDYGYDNLGQVTSGKKKVGGGTQLDGYSYEYEFDGIGNRETATANGQTKQYAANALNQYDWSTDPGAIDVVGKADSNTAVDVNFAAAGRQDDYYFRQLTSSNSTTAQYEHVTVALDGPTTIAIHEHDVYVPQQNISYSSDEDGNLLSDGRWNYTWDGENRLSTMESYTTAPAASKRKFSFIYDYMGRRSATMASTWNTTSSTWNYLGTTLFFYEGWTLVGEVDGSGKHTRYTWGLDLSGTPSGAGGVGGLLMTSVWKSGIGWQMSYPVADANGNIMKLLDAQTLETAAEYEYGPFGELIRADGSRAAANRIRFSSKYQDEGSGLLYYGYRYYDAGVGRWINRDPIGEKSDRNIYLTVGNNLVNSIDVLGLNRLAFFVKTEIESTHKDVPSLALGVKTTHLVIVNDVTGEIIEEEKQIYPTFEGTLDIPGGGHLSAYADLNKCTGELKVVFVGVAWTNADPLDRFDSIDYQFTYKVNVYSYKGTLKGKHDGFPSYLSIFNNLDGTGSFKYYFHELSPDLLNAPMDIEVNESW